MNPKFLSKWWNSLWQLEHNWMHLIISLCAVAIFLSEVQDLHLICEISHSLFAGSIWWKSIIYHLVSPQRSHFLGIALNHLSYSLLCSLSLSLFLSRVHFLHSDLGTDFPLLGSVIWTWKPHRTQLRPVFFLFRLFFRIWDFLVQNTVRNSKNPLYFPFFAALTADGIWW